MRRKYTIEEKVQAVLDYKNGIRGLTQIGIDLGMNLKTARTGVQLLTWVKQYDKYGEAAFYPKNRNKTYSKEFKEMVVREYLDGKGSTYTLSIKHDILSVETLRKWIISYNSHEELKDYNPKGDVYMASARRKTTIEERIEIVKY